MKFRVECRMIAHGQLFMRSLYINKLYVKYFCILLKVKSIVWLIV